MNKKNIKIVAAILGVILVHCIFRWTGFIQEDAFISWRCAELISQTGNYGFNAGEKVSASTTHLYVFISALFSYISGKYFITLILCFNFVALMTGLFLITRTIFSDFNKKLILWFCIAISPFAAIIQASGMETSILILVIGLLCCGLYLQKNTWIAIIIVLLPWIRPDAVVIGGIFLIIYGIKHRTIPILYISLFVLGIAGLLFFNFLYFGTLLNQTIIAKRIAYPTTYTFARIFESSYKVLVLDGGIFAPFKSKYFHPIGIVISLTAICISCYYL